ncbi:hypothetical protein [Pandoraea soli]
MLAHTSTYDTLASLEQQVDLLTELVAALIAGSPAPAWAQAFITAMQTDSSVATGSESTTTTSVSAQKNKNRGLQAAYLTAVNPGKT